jgi:hypothetical protein
VIFQWTAMVIDAWLALAREVRRAWRALPGDLLGRVVMRGCGIDAPTREVASGDVTAVLVEDPRVALWFRAHLIPVKAQTLGHFVLARDVVSEDVLAHECEHIRQWSRFGPLYLPLYFGSSALAWLRGRRPYWDNVFETAARGRSERDTAAAREAGRS